MSCHCISHFSQQHYALNLMFRYSYSASTGKQGFTDFFFFHIFPPSSSDKSTSLFNQYHWGLVIYNKVCTVEVNSLMNFDGWTTPCNTTPKTTQSASSFSENPLHPRSPHSLLRQSVIKLIPNLLFMLFLFVKKKKFLMKSSWFPMLC